MAVGLPEMTEQEFYFVKACIDVGLPWNMKKVPKVVQKTIDKRMEEGELPENLKYLSNLVKSFDKLGRKGLIALRDKITEEGREIGLHEGKKVGIYGPHVSRTIEDCLNYEAYQRRREIE